MQEHDIRLWHGGTEPMTTVFFRFRISAGLGGGFQGMWTRKGRQHGELGGFWMRKGIGSLFRLRWGGQMTLAISQK